ncbi:MAG: DinB family protein, partial [Urechidicola sp.]|nr:DinB family protein [Urechidicola sp.]
MINAIEKNLERGIKLLNSISNQQYSDTSIAPYYSSIGGHIRHILDVFDCLFEGLPNGLVDLSARKRNELVEIDTAEGIIYF